jgi:hypothetical protein
MLLAAPNDSMWEVGLTPIQLYHPPAYWAVGGIAMDIDRARRICIFRAIHFNRCAKFLPGQRPLGRNHNPVLKQAKNPAEVPMRTPRQTNSRRYHQ